jgi:hypothetical protein
MLCIHYTGRWSLKRSRCTRRRVKNTATPIKIIPSQSHGAKVDPRAAAQADQQTNDDERGSGDHGCASAVFGCGGNHARR